MYAQDSIDLLIRSGIDFQKKEIKWISFHSGYDFGYLLKVLTCKPLPAEEPEFLEQARTYFPCIYDIKFLMKSCKNLKGGLNDLAEDLKV
jgi:CCR4-NOT transcription complex subunit 7/8